MFFKPYLAVKPRFQFIRTFSGGFQEQWGRATLVSMLAAKLNGHGNAQSILNILMNTGAVSLVALSLQTTEHGFYARIAETVASKGLEAANQWISDIYSPYLDSSLQPVRLSAAPLNSSVPDSLPNMLGSRPESRPESRPVSSPVSSEDSMDLFDSETWLAESPTAQRLWKEAE